MEEKILKLKNELSQFNTKDILGMIGTQFMAFGNDGKEIAKNSDVFTKTKLDSPRKQYLYLAGLLLSTDECSNSKSLDENTFKKIESEIQNITSEYSMNFLNITPLKTKEDIDKNIVSYDAFSSYFNISILRYPEQIIDLINSIYQPFDKELEENTGLTTKDYLNFYKFICDEFQETSRHFAEVSYEIREFTSKGKFSENKEKALKLYETFKNATDNLLCSSCTKIIEKFGNNKGEKFIKYFIIKREKREFIYYNSANPFVKQPLVYIDDNVFFITHPTFLLDAIYSQIHDVCENASNVFFNKFQMKKATIVEDLFLNEFKKVFNDKAIYYKQVCEKPGTDEHDILIEYDKYIIIAEVKASKVREPLFNPDKAYIRIKDHFDSHNGIGYAYHQAIKLKKFILASNDVNLYSDKNKKFTINNTANKIIIPIVLTLNQFGILAINVSNLLEKKPNEPYPWVCNLHDFQNIIEMNEYLNKNCDDLLEYILWRIDKHELIHASDELDIVEAYYEQKILLNELKDIIYFEESSKNLIDKIYFEKKGIPYEYKNNYEIKMVKSQPIKKNKIGRNDKCPCGSGKKYKYCCLGK